MAEVTPAISDHLTRGKAFYTIPDLVARWGVSRSTIYNEIRRGRLKRKHIAG